MSVNVNELDLWIKSNWTKKFDKRTGLGEPTANGVVGLGVLDMYEDILSGNMYIWTLELSQYTGNPLFKGFVKSDTDVSSFLPMTNGQFVVAYGDFKLNGQKVLRVGNIVTSTGSNSTLSNFSTNSVLTSSVPTWKQLDQNTGGIGVDIIRLDASRHIVIENSNGQIVTSVDSIFDVIQGTLVVGKVGAKYSSIAAALADAGTSNLITVHPGTYTGNLVVGLDTVVISGADTTDDPLTIVSGNLSTNAGTNKLRLSNIAITGTSTIANGASHKVFNSVFAGDVTLGTNTGIVEFHNCQFKGNVSVLVASTATIYFYNCKFEAQLSNAASNAIVLSNTKQVPSSLTGNKSIVGMYGDTLYAAASFGTTVADTTGYKMLVIDATGQVKTADVGAGGNGSGGKYTNATAVPTTIGGISSGTTFNQVSYDDMFTMLLYPYQTPSFGSFAIAGLSDTEVGNTYASQMRNVSWSMTNSSNVNASSVRVIDVSGGNAVLASSLSNTSPASVSIPSLTLSTAGAKQFRIEATNTKAVVFNRTLNINWQWAIHYGESPLTSLTSTEVRALRVKSLTSTANGTYAMQAGSYKYIAYPVSFGLKSNFKDQATNLDVAMIAATTVSVTNAYGITTNYYVHRTLNQLGGSITILVS